MKLGLRGCDSSGQEPKRNPSLSQPHDGASPSPSIDPSLWRAVYVT